MVTDWDMPNFPSHSSPAENLALAPATLRLVPPRYAVRRYQAQHKPSSKLPWVAARVTTLSQRVRPDTAQVIASFAAIAAPEVEPSDLARLLEQSQEGRLLDHKENAHFIRSANWQQLDSISPHWKALLLYLQTNEHGEEKDAGPWA